MACAIDDYCASIAVSREAGVVRPGVRRGAVRASKLVVHRDLKPGNILVTAQGEPKLLDFGIAKLLSFDPEAGAPALTAEMGRMMTPGYASPEQIRDEPVTTATDVYQLGVVLYELVTGRLPFQVGPTTTLSKLEQEICRRDAPKPGIDADLDGVILKAMAKEPGRRYASAAEFAADVERYLGGFPVQARPASRSYIAWRFVRRHRLATITAALFLVVMLRQ